MKHKLLVYLFFCTLFIFQAVLARGQQLHDKTVPELKNELSKAKTDTLRVKLLLEMSRNLLFRSGASKNDKDSANLLMLQAQRLSNKLPDAKWQGRTALMSTLLNNNAGQRDKGLADAQKALSIFIKINDIPDQGEAYILIGQHYGDSGKDMEQKINFYRKAADVFIKTGKRDRAAATLKDIGDLQSVVNNNPAALKSLQESLEVYKSYGEKDLQGLYDLMGYVLTKMGDYTDGLKYGLLAVKTAENQKDSSLQLCTILNRVGFTYAVLEQYQTSAEYRKKALSIAQKYKDSNSITVISFNMIATLFVTGKFNEALKINQEIDKNSRKGRTQELDLQITYTYLKIFIAMKEFPKAASYLKKLQGFAGKIVDSPELDEIRLRGSISFYQATGQWEKSYPYIHEHEILCREKNLSIFGYAEHKWYFRADSALKKYESAIKHYQRYKAINDSVFNEKKTKQTALLKIQYETDKKDNDLLLKAKDIQLLVKKIRSKKFNLNRTK